MSFWIAARDLTITWSDDPQYWNWTDHYDHSQQHAVLQTICWLEIIGKVNVRRLHVKTSYSAYLVFRLEEWANELEKAIASVRFVKEIAEDSADEGYTVFLDTKNHPGGNGRFPRDRGDGWMEIKLGEFFSNLGDDGEVELRLIETKNPEWKTGLVVRGIDLRPN